MRCPTAGSSRQRQKSATVVLWGSAEGGLRTSGCVCVCIVHVRACVRARCARGGCPWQRLMRVRRRPDFPRYGPKKLAVISATASSASAKRIPITTWRCARAPRELSPSRRPLCTGVRAPRLPIRRILLNRRIEK